MTTEVTNPPVVDGSNPGGNPEQKDQISYESFQKALKEKKNAAAKAEEATRKVAELSEKLEAIEREKLEAQGKVAEVKDRLAKENLGLKKQLEEKEKSYAWSIVSKTIKNAVIQNGGVEADDLLRVLSKDDLALVSVKDGYEVDDESLNAFIKTVKEKKPLYFPNKAAIKTNDVAVKGKGFEDVKPKQTSQMNAAELAQAMREQLKGIL
jgi:hypothetical protein